MSDGKTVGIVFARQQDCSNLVNRLHDDTSCPRRTPTVSPFVEIHGLVVNVVDVGVGQCCGGGECVCVCVCARATTAGGDGIKRSRLDIMPNQHLVSPIAM
jgi:hypothetical protein